MAGNTTERFRETVREQAEQGADTARQELGETVLDAADRYFPEAVQQRRRKDMATGALLGAFLGFLAGVVVSNR